MPVKKFDSKRDYYRVLGVGEKASQREVDLAFRNKARKHHPDGGGTDEEMKSLNEARAILTDPETRRAYDLQRRPMPLAHQPKADFDPYAASRAGTLKIPVANADLAGLLMGAGACFGIGIPLLLLVEMQWMFFLWPLRILSLGAVALGILLAHSALRLKHRQVRTDRPNYPRSVFMLHEIIFWCISAGVVGLIAVLLYV